LFKLNATFDNEINPDLNLHNVKYIDCPYYSPHSFDICKNGVLTRNNVSLSFLHNNVRSLKKNLETFQNHLLSEINFQFTAIAVTETRIVKGKPLNFNPNVPGYLFEYVPTPLSAGGVGVYIRENCRYSVLEKVSNIYYQVLWVEIRAVQ
jgi:hypothetical protein